MRLTNIDQTSIRNKSVVTLERSSESGLPDIRLTIYALPPTYPDDAEAELPSPQARFTGFAKDGKGRVEKDANNKPVKLYDDDDPDYLKELARVRQLQSIKMIYDATDHDEIQFDAKLDSQKPEEFYTAIRQEMNDFGFSLGDFVALIEAVSEVSGIDDEDLEAARTDFFEPAISPSASSSTKPVKN